MFSVFSYLRYFKFLEARFGQQAKKSRNEEDSDASSISDDEFDAYLRE